ncbi:MAG: addiction module protein [Planctomycetes bacterium]|nr:addiction module protein [Planctomycetota bacterium]
MSDFQSVLSAACQLPVAERLQLIDELAATVPDDTPPVLPEAWLAEVERRSEELDAGTVTAESWPQIRQRLFEKLDIRRED